MDLSVVADHPSLTSGDPVRWVGSDYVEHLGDGSYGRVHRGEIGRFVTVDGADQSGAVVDFPSVGAFVCAWSDISVVPEQD